MAFADIHREHVLNAIREFDALGREKFLELYGFGNARAYWLKEGNKRYDSKAVLGVAHRYARPDLGILPASEFSGGEATVERKLSELGFEVERNVNTRPEGRSSFLLTWTERGWPHSELLKLVRRFEASGTLDEPWRFKAHRQAAIGDRVWVLRQGKGAKGIFAVGEISGSPHPTNPAGGAQMSVPVRFLRFVDPRATFLIDEDDLRRVLPEARFRLPASGYRLSEEEAQALEELLPGDYFVDPNQSDEQPFDPTSVADGRERILATIAKRRGQRAFREHLISAYAQKCAVTGCSVIDILEAAHIHPYLGPETNKVSNGLLLRADIHTLFDCHLLTVDHLTKAILVHPRLRETEYGAFHQVTLRLPARKGLAPSAEALRQHQSAAGSWAQSAT